MRRRPLPVIECVNPARRDGGASSKSPPTISFEIASLPDGVLLRCEGVVHDATSKTLLRAIGRLLALPVPYLCIDLRDIESADRTLMYVLEASSAVAALEGAKLEIIPGPAALAVIQPPEGESD